MSKLTLYREIRRRCHLVYTQRSRDYEYRIEYYKHGNIQYAVRIKETPCRRNILGIYGSIYNVTWRD